MEMVEHQFHPVEPALSEAIQKFIGQGGRSLIGRIGGHRCEILRASESCLLHGLGHLPSHRIDSYVRGGETCSDIFIDHLEGSPDGVGIECAAKGGIGCESHDGHLPDRTGGRQ